jgi:hypothetical protein
VGDDSDDGDDDGESAKTKIASLWPLTAPTVKQLANPAHDKQPLRVMTINIHYDYANICMHRASAYGVDSGRRGAIDSKGLKRYLAAVARPSVPPIWRQAAGGTFLLECEGQKSIVGT